MPHEVMEKMLTARRKPASFEKFYDEQKKKMVKRKPVKTKSKTHTGTMFAKRNKRLTIREAALRGVSILVDYRKVSGERKKYLLNPISYRYRKLKKGWRKVLFVEDKKENKQIKMFVVQNIQNVVLTDQKYKSQYSIEIK